MPELHRRLEGAHDGVAVAGRNLDGTGQPAVADIHHVLCALQSVNRAFEMRRQLGGLLHEVFPRQDLQRGEAGGAGHRVRRVGVTVGEFHGVFRNRLPHEGLVDLPAGDHCAQRHGAVGNLLGNIHDVRGDAEILRAAVSAETTEAGDHLVEDQQDVVGIADFAQALQVTRRRHDYTGRAGHRFDDHCGDVRGVVQFNQAQQIIGQLNAAGFGHALGKGQAGLQGVWQMIGVHHQAEALAVAAHAAQRGAGDVHAVVATGAANQLGLAGLAFDAPVGAGHLDRGVGAFGAGVGEKHVIKLTGQALGNLLRQLEGQRMAVLEARRVIERAELLADSCLDFLARMPRATGPQSGQAVVDAPALVVGQPAAFGGDDQARIALEVAVGAEGHPVGVQLELGGQG